MSKDTPEPAFANSHPEFGSSGMSLRDYFAGQALIGFSQVWGQTEINKCINPAVCAESAYAIADAMLVERVKEGRS